MRRLGLICLIIVVFSSSAWAQEVSTLVSVRNDWIRTSTGENLQSQGFFSYWGYERTGLGMDLARTHETGSTSVKPFFTWRLLNALHLVGGVATNSHAASDHVNLGVWFCPTIGKARVFIDLREYVDISGKKSDYIDFFMEVTHPVTENVSVGVVTMYNRWWHDDNHEWFFIGPIGYYQLSKSVSVFCRPSYDWEKVDGKTISNKRVRVGLKFNF